MNFANETLDDCLVQFQDSSGELPVTVVASSYNQESAQVVDNSPGNAYEVSRRLSAHGLPSLEPKVWSSIRMYHVSMTAIDRASGQPVYRQVAEDLRRKILEGQLVSGSRLPPEPELMNQYGAARGTIRQSIALLRAEGLVDIEHGRGSFVRSRPPVVRLGADRFARRHRIAGKAAFLAEMEAQGRKPEVEVLQVRPEQASAEIAKRLGLRAGSRVLVRRRRYLADGQPLELATSYLPWQLVKGTPICEANPGPGGIYARLEELGHRLKRLSEDVTARMPLQEETGALQLRAGTPVFNLVRTAFDAEDRAVEVCDTVMAADRYVLSYELPAR
jgi:GntR family transcriptional regulator